jgi:hypothetical protein
MFITPPVARVSLATARAFYARKLRFWAKSHGRPDGGEPDPS